eukprot:2750322-Alexandrium_andersonii.AAC.1
MFHSCCYAFVNHWKVVASSGHDVASGARRHLRNETHVREIQPSPCSSTLLIVSSGASSCSAPDVPI